MVWCHLSSFITAEYWYGAQVESWSFRLCDSLKIKKKKKKSAEGFPDCDPARQQRIEVTVEMLYPVLCKAFSAVG